MMHLRRKYALLLLTIFAIWLSSSALPLDCCCNIQPAVEMTMSKVTADANCHKKVNPKSEAGTDAEHCPVNGTKTVDFATKSDNTSSQEQPCCSGQDADNTAKEEIVINVSQQCSTECMIVNASDTDQVVTLSRINTASPTVILQISQIVKRIPSITTVQSLAPQIPYIDILPIFLIHNSFLI